MFHNKISGHSEKPSTEPHIYNTISLLEAATYEKTARKSATSAAHNHLLLDPLYVGIACGKFINERDSLMKLAPMTYIGESDSSNPYDIDLNLSPSCLAISFVHTARTLTGRECKTTLTIFPLPRLSSQPASESDEICYGARLSSICTNVEADDICDSFCIRIGSRFRTESFIQEYLRQLIRRGFSCSACYRSFKHGSDLKLNLSAHTTQKPVLNLNQNELKILLANRDIPAFAFAPPPSASAFDFPNVIQKVLNHINSWFDDN